jgi:hypothetical protein
MRVEAVQEGALVTLLFKSWLTLDCATIFPIIW